MTGSAAGGSSLPAFGRPTVDSPARFPHHAVALVWLLVLGPLPWPMLVTVVGQLGQGTLALPAGWPVSRTTRRIVADLAAAGLAECGQAGWQLTVDGRRWCWLWRVWHAKFAAQVVAAGEFSPR